MATACISWAIRSLTVSHYYWKNVQESLVASSYSQSESGRLYIHLFALSHYRMPTLNSDLIEP